MSNSFATPWTVASVHGIFQARILEWAAIPFARGSSQTRNRTLVSCIVGRFFTIWATNGPNKRMLQSVLLGQRFSMCCMWGTCFAWPRYKQRNKVLVSWLQPKVWGSAFLRNAPHMYQEYWSLRITEDDPNLKIRELLCGTRVHGSVESDYNELDGLQSVSLWTSLFLEDNYLGETKAA